MKNYPISEEFKNDFLHMGIEPLSNVLGYFILKSKNAKQSVYA